jgi:hypothetical protein
MDYLACIETHSDCGSLKKGVVMMTNEADKKTYPDGRRCTVDLTPAAAQEVDRICGMFSLKIADLFRYSLLLMRIYADAVQEGKQMRLVSRKDPHEIQVVELPLFGAGSQKTSSSVAGERNVARTG